MILFINTTLLNKIQVALIRNGKIVKQISQQAKYKHSEKLLPAIDKLLKSQKIGIEKLKGIIVVKGPGAFSAVRTGVIVANTLAYILNIKLAGITADNSLEKMINYGIKELKSFKIVEPFYGKELNIT